MTGKVFVLGIDGGTFDIILPLIEKGKLPNMAGLLKDGAWGNLQSTIHPITPAAWSSFATGKNPGKHGIFDFSSPNPDNYSLKLNSAMDRKAETFWGLLSRSDKKVIVLNVPFTYPPEKVNGIMISGFDAPGANRTMAYPQEIYNELVKEFEDYTPDWTFPVGKKYNFQKYWNDVVSTIQRRTETSLYLLRKYPWDIFVTVFSSIDHIQHIFFGTGEEGKKVIEEGYELMDKALGSFLEEIGKDNTIIIMSDHGAGQIKKFFYLDQWLSKEGYLTFKKTLWYKDAVRMLTRKGRHFSKKMLPVRARGYLRGRLPSVRDFVVSYTTGQEIDWSKTNAYSGGMYGNIYINKEGDRYRGIVSEAEYDNLCYSITSRLCELKDPETGEKVVEKVYRKDELYNGPFVSKAPDLVVQWKDYAYFTKKGIDKKGAIFGDELKLESSDYPHTGTHRLNGIFLIKGPSILRQKKLENMHIIDLAPTILFLMDVPIPNDMDGRIATEMFKEGFLKKVHPQYSKDSGERDIKIETKAFTPEEQEEITKRLKSLGYIE